MESAGEDGQRGKKRKLDAAEGVVESTEANPLGIPNHPPYQIIIVPHSTFADVVAVPDVDMVRKLAQISFAMIKSKKTSKIYVTYDPIDFAYEITFEHPGDTVITYLYMSNLYRICPLLVTEAPYTEMTQVRTDAGDLEIVQTVTMRFASYRRPYLVIKETTLMLSEHETTIVPTQQVMEAAAAHRDPKRVRLAAPFFAADKGAH